jgi:uncharacterized protein
MKFRKFGRTPWEGSALGFGCMRLPTTDGKPGSASIDEREAVRLIQRGIDSGINYVDTAYPYHGEQSEIVVGRALQDGYRQRTKLATKSPVWLINSKGSFDRYLNEQLKKLKTDSIDYYLLHALDKDRWRNVIKRYNVLESAEAALRDGRIGAIGFSYHDNGDTFSEIVDGYGGWNFCQIQYNYLDVENQAGTKGLQYAASKGLAVVIMEPLLGGRLANPPGAVKDVFEASNKGWSSAEWALQWIWNQPEPAVVLSGMASAAQLEENLAAAERSMIGTFTSADHAVIEHAQHLYAQKVPIPCTNCGYCMPCPNGVNVPRNLLLYNDAAMHEAPGTPRFVYKTYVPASERADQCIICRECEPKCPQKIAIPDWLKKTHAVLSAS